MKSCRKWGFISKSKIIFLLPSLIGVTIFVLFPFLEVVVHSFQTAMTKKFCGLGNYESLFHNHAFMLAVRNTICFVGVCLPILIISSLIIAVAIYKTRWMQQLKLMYLFPLAVPTATVVLIWKMLFFKRGLLNVLLNSIGLTGINWLGSDASFWVLIISYVWKNLGYTIILWIAGLNAIPENIIEAAEVDGAGEISRFIYIIIPNLKPMFYTITILSFLNSFKVFREAYLVAGGYPNERMYLLQHIFNNWFMNLDVDKMAAAAVCIAVVFSIFVLLLQQIWDRKEE